MAPKKSTIVRTKILGLRVGFGLLEQLAPALGARFAERLWLTVPPYRGRPRPDVIPPGEPFAVSVGGRRVHGRTWGTGPAVYLVHGWGGVSVQLRDFLEPLLAAGYRVVSFDALSHGRSDQGEHGPRRTTIPELTAALHAVVTAHGPAHAVIAHSLGCVAAFTAMRAGLPIDRLVFLAPMTRPLTYTVPFAAALGFGERIRTRMVARVARRAGADATWSAYDLPARAADLPPTPLLVVHDPDDQQNHYADSVALVEAWPGATLLTVRELGHWRLLRDRDTIARAVAFVDTGRAAEVIDQAEAS